MITRFVAARAARSAAAWGAVFALYIAVSALGFVSAYPSPAERHALAQSLGTNIGVAALLGPAGSIDTVAGFTTWRCVAVLGLVGAVWGLLTGTRLLRGEEDDGRWELVLAGPTTRHGATRDAISGLLGGFAVLFAIPAAVTVAVGRDRDIAFDAGGALLLAFASVAAAAVFLMIGAVAAQLAATRRQAALAAGVILGVAFALRAVADSGLGLEWLRWLSPLGWIEEVHPFDSPRLVAALPPVITVLTLAAAAVVLAGRRDLGSGAVPARTTRRPPRPVRGAAALAALMTRPLALGWLAAAVFAGLLFGVIADSAGRALQTMSSARAALERLGARGSGATAYLGVAFFVIAVLVALAAAGIVAALATEEATGRLDHLLAQPLGRLRWLGGRLLPALLLPACGLAAGLAAALGTAAAGSHVGTGPVLQAGLNCVPAALFVTGVGLFAFGLRPRLAAASCYAVVAWSFLVQLIGGLIGLNHWLLDLSVFRHVAPAPAVPVDWAAAASLASLGVAAAVIGAIAFRARDISGA